MPVKYLSILFFVSFIYFIIPGNPTFALTCGSYGNTVEVSTDGNPDGSTGEIRDANGLITKIKVSDAIKRYYLHTKKICQKNLQAQSVNPTTGVGSTGAVPWGVEPFGAYVPNSSGVVRADIVKGMQPALYRARFRPDPAGENESTLYWSNPVDVEVVSSASAGADTYKPVTINLADYWLETPGLAYIYETDNKYTNSKAEGRLQIEEAIDWCGNKVVPWRFTKKDYSAYWGPRQPGVKNIAQQSVLRWMIAKQDFVPSAYPQYKDYIWGVGHKLYSANIDDDYTNDFQLNGQPIAYKDIPNPTSPLSPRTYVSYTSTPAYGVGKKSLAVPNSISIFPSDFPNITNSQTCPISNQLDPASNPVPATAAGWLLRYEFENININRTDFKYAGPALRIDFYEYGSQGGKYDFGKSYVGTDGITYNPTPGFRETWYLVKNIGFVKIVMNGFNGYASTVICPNDSYSMINGIACTKTCSSTADCNQDSVADYQSSTEVTGFYNNPTLTASVLGKGDTAFSDSTYIRVGESYQVKVSPNYTGYLEAKTDKIQKWLWVDKGLVQSPIIDAAFLNKKIPFSLRVWAPNDIFPNETRITDTAIPWSNNITVTIVAPGDLDGNLAIDAVDSSIMLNSLANKTDTRLIKKAFLDLNSDNFVDLKDLVKLLTR